MSGDALLAQAITAAEQAGAIALRYFRTRLAVENKVPGAFDPVTAADREIEIFLRAELARIDPGAAIIGEEFGTTGEAGADYWIVDPIDGTRAFMSGMLGWGILLGHVQNGVARRGILHQPFTRETFFAGPGGAFLRHDGETATLRTSGRETLDEAVLYSTDPMLIEAGDLTAKFTALARACRLQRWGGDCYAFGLLAQGSIDLVVEGPIAPYDIVPLISIIEGAGGVVTDLAGRSPLGGGSVVAAASRPLHEAALRLLTAPDKD